MMPSRTKLFLVTLTIVTLAAAVAAADIVCVPDTLALDEATPSADIVLNYTGGGSANVAGYSVDIQWDVALATATFDRPASGAFSAAATFFVVDLGPGHVRVDAAIGGADPGITAGDLCVMTLTAVAGQTGGTAVDVVILGLRDPDNADVTGVVALGGQLSVDAGAPQISDVLITNDTLAHTDDYLKDTDALTITATVTDNEAGFGAGNISADLSGLGGGAAAAPDSYVGTTATWTVASAACTPADGEITVTITAVDQSSNTSNGSDTIIADNTAPTALLGLTVLPGHEQLHLAWSDIAAADANPMGVAFRYNVWGDYPAYDTAAPDYPADNAAGSAAVEVTSGTTADWAVTTRDIYYVAGFVYDMVLHYGAAGAENTGRATNYWLGDVVGADGVVDVINDINRLGTAYGLADTDPGFDPECDVAPTDTRSPRGIPEPNGDHEVGFEDMMVFALNYSVVTPSTKSAAGGTPVLAWRQLAEDEWALDLVANGGDLQGLQLNAELPAGVTCSVRPGELAAAQDAPVFLRNIPQHGLDAGLALFGRGVGFAGSGELVRVSFSVPVVEPAFAVSGRDADNGELALQLDGPAGTVLPKAVGFDQNFPNPFNPQTTLAFSLPDDRPVHIAIYALDGSRVRTLVDGARPAGRNEVVWDGRDDSGRALATGTYFARLLAGDFHETRKMSLVK